MVDSKAVVMVEMWAGQMVVMMVGNWVGCSVVWMVELLAVKLVTN